LSLAAADIKLAHSVFALPFAVLGACMAWPQGESAGRFAGKLLLVVACMVLARTWAMLVNRIADAGFDANNPRTARRAVASGQLPKSTAIALASTSAGLFVLVTGLFGLFYTNYWPLALSVPVLGWLALYSYAKRFTALCHVLLGSALAISPLAAAIAIGPAAVGLGTLGGGAGVGVVATVVPALFWLSGMVLLWVAGFDVLYALQDEAFDRGIGLHSLPSRLGKHRAVWLSRAMHAGAAGCLIVAAVVDHRLHSVFPVAVAIACVCLVAEHIVLIRRGLAGLPMAFFTLNGVISCVVGAAGVLDVLVIK